MTPSIAGIRRAAAQLAAYFPPTPLVRAPLLSQRLDADVFIKNETVSPVASFKWRGALTDVLRNRDARGVVTSSTGNHGQGVAWAASVAGLPAHIFLPHGANLTKRAKIELLGATIHETGRDLDEAKETAIAFARDEELLFIDDGESVGVIEGAATVGFEIAGALLHVDSVFVPMGSGSLAGGVALAVKARHARARVVAVQSTGSPAMVDSFHARKAIEKPASTIADGLICRVPAQLALDTIVRYVDDAVAIDDESILAAAFLLMTEGHVLVEPSGAAGLAAALRGEIRGRTIVLVATGANVTPDVLKRITA
ncbi:MAG TPA: pyridoxal-phosphate dependent enzyme [Thermoanaerobaculia bacterium]